MNVIETTAPGSATGEWALRDCTLTIPGGHLVALVGPNGRASPPCFPAVGLTRPTAEHRPCSAASQQARRTRSTGSPLPRRTRPLQEPAGRRDARRRAHLNKRWDQRHAEDRLVRLEIPLSQHVGTLSGGQKAQLALTIALARRPALLVLDEPFSALDPVAREDFLASVVGAARDDGISVVLSSHVLAELERVATYLVVLGRGEVRVAASRSRN